jgi:hypothetical protein
MDSYLTYYRAKRRAEISKKEIDNFTFIDKTPCERIHLNFCKFTLGAKKTSSNIGVRAEVTRGAFHNDTVNFISSSAPH